ncbi:carbohydrate-binding module family 13 protein [Rhizophagus irregularis DAOM 181602=DAOM 197198]|nr:carbohydrate-binding module family 13 protein [Rhizophagus irregularis DAOM 181602=DAOM 197198]
MSEKLLISIIQDSNLKTSDVQIWEQVHCTNPGLSSDSSSYSNDDFNTLKNTLQKIIPFMGFTSREFLYNVFPYRKILPNELYIDLLKLFLNSDYRPNKKNRKVIDSKIITIQHVELITKWIDKLRITDEIKNSYDFKLIFRGSRDGFSPNKFHEICDNESGTVSIFKVKYSDEILGGYNPIEWKSDMDENLAIRYWDNYGPSFGSGDLTIYGGYGGFRNESNFCSNGYNYCRKASYEKNIRVSDYTFSVEDYEVFQIIKN